MKIIVIGSLGNIGKPLTKMLLQRGHSVTVISSNPERKKEIEVLGATAAIGLVDDVDFLTATFTGADVVHAMIPPTFGVPDMIAHARIMGEIQAKAIEVSGVKKVIYVSSYGAELEKGAGLIVGHHYIENALLNLPGLESLILLRATYIYYNFYRLIDMIKNAGFIAANYGGDDRVVMVSPEDIAAASVEEIESAVTGKRVRYVASDVHTCNEIAQILGAAIGKPDLKWLTISDGEMQKAYEANGIPAHTAAAFVEMFGAIHSGLLHEDYDKHQPELGKVKLEDFAKDFAAAFNR
jgi:uncharacterized protein YbjT (DUF2867 family)